MADSRKKQYNSFLLSRFLRKSVALIWPDTCVLCNDTLRTEESALCLKCLSEIPRIRTDSTIFHVGAPGNAVRVKSWFIYDHLEPAHRLIHDIKYHDCRKLARKLGREFAMQKLMDGDIPDIIIPIPIHWTKFIKRSYNQAFEIALGIKDVTGITVSKNLYTRRAHASQTHNTQEERLENVRDIFALRNPAELNGRHIAILDDVITTGATMLSALSTILANSSPASVTFLSLAKTSN